MLKNFVKIFGGDPNRKTIEELSDVISQINALEPHYESYTNEQLRACTDEFRERIKKSLGNLEGLEPQEQFQAEQEALSEILVEAFAVVREASKRALGLRHYDVQLIGGIILHRGSIAEMRTGEGKTLVATLPVYLNALLKKGIHLITVNDYLARRDARWMAPVFHLLGISVGVLQMAAVTENGKKAFIVDFERESPHEDQHHLRLVDRVEAYNADVTYGTNSEFGFDYLRDNMTNRLSDRVQRGHEYAIIDEVDNVLIDEARTPLIISGPSSGDLEWYGKMAQVIKQLKPEDYEINEKDRNVSITEIGLTKVEGLLGETLMNPDRPEDVTPRQARLRGYLEQALRAQFLFRRNKEYLVQAGKVVIVDDFTGRLMPGRRWSDGLHQAVEAKENVRIEPENITYATITLQNYFRMYKKLSGMTGTALTESEEFSKIYELDVAPIPPNLEYQAFGKDAPLVEVKTKDSEGYTYSYFARREDADQAPLFYRRKDYPDVIYRTVEAKLRSMITEVIREHVRGRPLLIGTTSVESSEMLSLRLKTEPIRRLMQISLVRHIWLRENDREEDGRLIPELAQFNEPLEKISADTLRKFIQPFGVSTISLDDPSNFPILLDLLGLDESDSERLKKVLQSGVTHQVLNARKHTEESQIIADAGAFGAVTIATNMAGRGVDIKLGGELAEEVITAVNRVLGKAGVDDPFDRTHEERRIALQNVDASNYGIYADEVGLFLNYFKDMERVKELGGLHVIGSERHEARRIDNQLRGRAARQGDPGSSRFYLSLEDDLMRLFGGDRVNSLMQTLKVDDSLPLEVRLVANIIENSQQRVEGANFDVRKHLLEYDDVLNNQRTQIYNQRDRIFVKDDLSSDIEEMLENEIQERTKTGLEDEEGPWKLVSWLEEIQPAFTTDSRMFPSFGMSLLLRELHETADFKSSVLDLVKRAIEIENSHHLNALENLIDRTEDAFKSQLASRLDALDTFFDGFRDREDSPRPQKLLEEINSLLGMQIRLNGEQLRLFDEDVQNAKETIINHITGQLAGLYASRLIATAANRVGASLGDKFELRDWDHAVEMIYDLASDALEKRKETLVGENGQIERDIHNLMPSEINETTKLQLLINLSQGSRTVFDQRNHRQVKQVYTRFSYIFLIAELCRAKDAEQFAEEVLEHLDNAEESMISALGHAEFNRIASNATQLGDFGEAARKVFGDNKLNDPVISLGESDREALIEGLGGFIMNESRRQLLLRATSELWVEYLTRIEALRVSIGLEAYAQRDPLVQYKRKASEMFAQLVDDIRGLVTSRAFTLHHRPVEITPVETANATTHLPGSTTDPSGKSKKRKRRRS